MSRRGSGILLHITSLPSSTGIGDLGPCANIFADFLSNTRQKYWQVLPFNPTSTLTGNSPYNSVSAFACNTLLISPEIMICDNFLRSGEIPPLPEHALDKVHYPGIIEWKNNLFTIAYDRFAKKKEKNDFDDFCTTEAEWLDDFALYTAVKNHYKGTSWHTWPEDIRDRKEESIKNAKKDLYKQIEKIKFLQYLFFSQWFKIKKYCNNKGIKIIGDIPIYVHYDSADVWTNPHIFKLSSSKKLTHVSGVPPDYFSRTGQRWGNPVYNWDVLKKEDFSWWVKRMKHNLRLFDIVRIDHFRGLSAYWEIKASDKTAVHGKWVPVPGYDFLNTLKKHFPSLPVIAEDLGYITEDVRKLIKHFKLPNMKVLQFAFGDTAQNPYLPHNYNKNCIVYTGTHDNNTTAGWYKGEVSPKAKKRLSNYFGMELSPENAHWAIIRLGMMSIADTAITPMQDILGLGSEYRMNIPGKADKNWQWRLLPNQLTPHLEKRLLKITKTYNRI